VKVSGIERRDKQTDAHGVSVVSFFYASHEVHLNT